MNGKKSERGERKVNRAKNGSLSFYLRCLYFLVKNQKRKWKRLMIENMGERGFSFK